MRGYFLRLTACAFLVTLLSALVRSDRLRPIVRLCGGCLTVLIALQPLVGLDFSRLPDLLYPYGLSQQNLADEARRKNDALLESLIREQTEQAVYTLLEAQNASLEFDLKLQMDQAVGAPVPWAITFYGNCSQEQKDAIAAYLRDSLGIPEERQAWKAN